MLDIYLTSSHHTTLDMCPTATSLAILTIFLMSVESIPQPPQPPRGDVSETRRITDLQLLHPMPVLPPLDRGSPDGPFSNIPSEAFTLDTEHGSKRTFKKDLGLDPFPRGDLPSDPLFLLLQPAPADAAERNRSDDGDHTLEWFTSADMAGLRPGADSADSADTAGEEPASVSAADEWNSILWKLMQNPYLNSLQSNEIDKQIYDIFTQEVGSQQRAPREPMAPFVDRGELTPAQAHAHGFVQEHYDPRDPNDVHYGSDKVYYGLHRHRGSKAPHYGPHRHYPSGDGSRDSNKEPYDSNKQHYFGSNKVRYDPNKKYYGRHEHYGSNKEYYGPHKHYKSNNGHHGPHGPHGLHEHNVPNDDHYGLHEHHKADRERGGSTRDRFDSMTAEYGSDRGLPFHYPLVQSMQAVQAVQPGATETDVKGGSSAPVGGRERVALCGALYVEPECAGRAACAGRRAGASGPGGRRRQSWLVLGDGKDQSGQPAIVV